MSKLIKNYETSEGIIGKITINVILNLESNKYVGKKISQNPTIKKE